MNIRRRCDLFSIVRGRFDAVPLQGRCGAAHQLGKRSTQIQFEAAHKDPKKHLGLFSLLFPSACPGGHQRRRIFYRRSLSLGLVRLSQRAAVPCCDLGIVDRHPAAAYLTMFGSQSPPFHNMPHSFAVCGFRIAFGLSPELDKEGPTGAL